MALPLFYYLLFFEDHLKHSYSVADLNYYKLLYNFFCTISSTTAGSRSVVVSPMFSDSPSAIFLSIRRMIFPLLVLGKPETNCILSGLAIAPIILATV